METESTLPDDTEKIAKDKKKKSEFWPILKWSLLWMVMPITALYKMQEYIEKRLKQRDLRNK